MQLLNAKGLVVRTVNYGERDRILTIYTEELGLITATANGSRSLKSRALVATELFCYSRYVLAYKNDRYTVREVDLIESFFDLRTDIEKLTLAGYICEVIAHVGTENMPDTPLLRLALNSLYAIAKDKAPLIQIKGAFEMRAAAVLGFLPELSVCSSCGEEGENAVLDVMNGSLVCEACRREAENTPQEEVYDPMHPTIRCVLTDAARAALFYVTCAPIEKFLSFKLENSADMENFSRAAETYLLNHLETGFKSLDFYKQLIGSASNPSEDKK
jgi:DNA repair protein RecO (recombination protein O)